MVQQIRKINGHRLIDLACFLYSPAKTGRRYLEMGYSERFVKNQAKIFSDFARGSTVIKITAGDLDDICFGYRYYYSRSGKVYEKSVAALQRDAEAAGLFNVEIGATYSFMQIKNKLKDFYKKYLGNKKSKIIK
jgi:hypothetical protein